MPSAHVHDMKSLCPVDEMTEAQLRFLFCRASQFAATMGIGREGGRRVGRGPEDHRMQHDLNCFCLHSAARHHHMFGTR